jgi:hypothetical protein
MNAPHGLRTIRRKNRRHSARLAPAGRTVWRWDSGPFGSEAPDENSNGHGMTVTLNLRFPGQCYDAELEALLGR